MLVREGMKPLSTEDALTPKRIPYFPPYEGGNKRGVGLGKINCHVFDLKQARI